ncbi:hypothetical protein B0H66DRAFT_109246 [Apodospora peruviana]|uniref:Uncharacterized protein n=1 Tax=Apodospora peruviana TaxID=516989 RepID=A0AAE0IHJ1_9PEZI|nr:hypothetical protein B0H66DRAFT_109246 [Apodospora peruviana]
MSTRLRQLLQKEILHDYHTWNRMNSTTNGGYLFEKAMRFATCYGQGFPSSPILLFTGLDMGLGSPDAEVGDLLCLLGGYSMPVVLRPCGDFFRFVVNVYVCGIMHGEALAE